RNELPFQEPVKLQAIKMENELPNNLVALYSDFNYVNVAKIAEPVEDEVSTKLSSSDEEPVFLDYSESEPKKSEEPKEVVTETISQENIPEQKVVHNVDKVKDVDNKIEEVAIEELMAFDYSRAQKDLKEKALPTVTKMTTHQDAGSAGKNFEHKKWEVNEPTKSKPKVTTHKQTEALKDNTNKGFLPQAEVQTVTTHQNRVAIRLTGTDLKEVRDEVGFEVRFQDDLNETFQDYNTGAITVDHELASAKMTRSMTVLKRGYAPTNTDLILEEGVTEVVMPAIEEQTFNELLAPYGARGPIGAVLVELDENVEGASLDVPYSSVVKLNEAMQPTEGNDFVYELFVGVKAGNALLSYKSQKGEITSKIIHIHEHELTFETNFFETVKNEKVKLFEENLLGQDKTPLIISSEEVRQFASDKVSKKINDHTYKMNFNKTLLGGRKYLELSHQEEPVFVGFKENNLIDVPSENFMRYILSRFEGSKLGNRCLVQVNFNKKASKVDVAAESVGQSLVTYTQVLDADGRFYDSVGAKSRKLIIVGENQGAPGFSQDAKINVKVTYIDGSVDFIGSYCSPNTYLVEQL
ncbi:MAG: hypothetical protein ACLGHN_12470, partial [Bacteriovoracia bacterium]